jgi:hypothetical protein
MQVGFEWELRYLRVIGLFWMWASSQMHFALWLWLWLMDVQIAKLNAIHTTKKPRLFLPQLQLRDWHIGLSLAIAIPPQRWPMTTTNSILVTTKASCDVLNGVSPKLGGGVAIPLSWSQMSNANLNRSYQFTHSFIGVLEGGVSNDDESSAALPPWTMLIHNYHCKRGESEKSCRLNYSPSEFSKVVASEDASSTALPPCTIPFCL